MNRATVWEALTLSRPHGGRHSRAGFTATITWRIVLGLLLAVLTLALVSLIAWLVGGDLPTRTG
jgi:hypothetical protein